MIWAMLLACPREAPPAGQVTRNGLYRVTLEMPEPIPLSTLFEVDAVVVDRKGRPVEDAIVTIDARMPTHGHGMATKPEADPGTCVADVCTHPGGRYKTRGMKFHMPGDWVVSVGVAGPAGTDSVDIPRRL